MILHQTKNRKLIIDEHDIRIINNSARMNVVHEIYKEVEVMVIIIQNIVFVQIEKCVILENRFVNRIFTFFLSRMS